MHTPSVGGHITITIGGTPITLDSASLTPPLAFSLPEGQKVKVSLAALNQYLSSNIPAIPTISFPGITETNLLIDNFSVSTAGIFDIGVNFAFGNGKGWEIIPGLPGFTLNEVGFDVNFSAVPNVSSLSPATGPVGTTVTLTGHDLAAATAVKFGETPGTIVANSNTATSLQVNVPTGLAAGNANVTVTNADGTSAPFVFAVTAA